jgi:hypothetical protein
MGSGMFSSNFYQRAPFWFPYPQAPPQMAGLKTKEQRIKPERIAMVPPEPRANPPIPKVVTTVYVVSETGVNGNDVLPLSGNYDPSPML